MTATGVRTRESTITVFLVDDYAVVRRGLAAYLEGMADMTVVGEASGGEDALRRLAVMPEPPDVVLMDLIMPGMDGIRATAALLERQPGTQVVVVGSVSEGEQVRAALEAGASGYLLKNAEADEVATAVRAAMRGETHLSGRVARYLTRALAAPRSGLPALTAREREILALVATGRSNQDIANHVSISERTARTHVSNILAKLRLTSRTQAALLAIKEGLVPPPGPPTV